MANTRYWVGKAAGVVWNSSATTGWSLTSNGASGASVPTANDYVIFDNAANSGNCIIAAGAVCANFDGTTYASTIGCNGANVLVVGNSTGGPGLLTFGGNAKITNGTYVSKNNMTINSPNVNNAVFRAGNAFAGTLSMTSFTNVIAIVNTTFTVNGSLTIANAGVNTCTFTVNGFANVITNTVFTNTALTCNGILTLGNSTLVNTTAKAKAFSTNNNLVLANSVYINNMIINATATASQITISNGVTFSNSTINAVASLANITIGASTTFDNTTIYWGANNSSNNPLNTQLIFVGGTISGAANSVIRMGNSTAQNLGYCIITGNSVTWPGDIYSGGFVLTNSFSIAGLFTLGYSLSGGLYSNGKNLNLGAYVDAINASTLGNTGSLVDFSGMTLTFTCNTTTPSANYIINTTAGAAYYKTNSSSLAIFTNINGNCYFSFPSTTLSQNSMFNIALFNSGSGNVTFVGSTLFLNSIDFTGFSGYANSGSFYVTVGSSFFDNVNGWYVVNSVTNTGFVTLSSTMNASNLSFLILNHSANPNAVFDCQGISFKNMSIRSGNVIFANSPVISANLVVRNDGITTVSSVGGGAVANPILIMNNQSVVTKSANLYFANVIMGSQPLTITGVDTSAPVFSAKFTNWVNSGTIICNNQTQSSNVTLVCWPSYSYPNFIFNTGTANVFNVFFLANNNNGLANVTIGTITWNGSGNNCGIGFGVNGSDAVGTNYFNISGLFANGNSSANLYLATCFGTGAELGTWAGTGNGQAILNCASGVISLDYVQIGGDTTIGSTVGTIPNTGITATGGATFYAGPHSGNSAPAPGWIFGAVPNFGFFGHTGAID